MSQSSSPVCLITGGSSGIGLATAKRFASAGYQVAICGRDEAKLANAAAEIDRSSATVDRSLTTWTRCCDLVDVEQAKSLATSLLVELGRVDVLVNNAALAPLAALEEVTPESFESTINVNHRSVFYLTQAVWRAMKERPSTDVAATIVNVSSMAAVDPFPGFSIYGASKAWIELLTQALSTEGSEHGIRVCAVRPGAVETALLRGLFPDFPAGDCVSPDDVAEVIWGCVENPDQFPSGQAFTINGSPSS